MNVIPLQYCYICLAYIMHQTPVLDAGATTVNKRDKVSALTELSTQG